MQKRWSIFPLSVSYNLLMIIWKAYLEKSLNDLNKIYYLQGFHIIAISENTWKYDISDFKEDTYYGAPLQQIWML